jgi:hypothetical protein
METSELKLKLRRRSRVATIQATESSTLPIIVTTRPNLRHSSSAPHQSDLLTDRNASKSPGRRYRSSHPFLQSTSIKMPPKRIQVQPSTRRAPPPSNYFTAAWQTITSEENSSVVISLTMAAVSSSIFHISYHNQCDEEGELGSEEEVARKGNRG